MYRIAIAGNPNSGKTCIFNNLTGHRQSVGNYPGVTVEFFEGKSRFDGEEVRVFDLPGTYSLTAYSQEEIVARNFILQEHPDVLVDVVDSSNLERNLYLTAQFIELGIPIVIALNMVDIAEKKGLHVDPRKLSDILGVKVVPTVGSKRRGVEELKKACIETVEKGIKPKPIPLSHELQYAVQDLEKELEKHSEILGKSPARWFAIKLLEQDEEVLRRLEEAGNPESVNRALDNARHRVQVHSEEDASVCVIESRYGFASGAARGCTEMAEELKRHITEKIDAVVCNRFFGPIILGLVVYLLFVAVFRISAGWTWIPLFNGKWVSPVDLFGMFFNALGHVASGFIGNETLLSLIKDGIIGGVGGVMGFVPLIFVMFFFIALLEDSGYIARVAFLMDRILRAFGLQGKSVLAMIVSGGLGAGGCAVPGVMATRTLREEKDRLVTILVVPIMNCGAKMPVYAMFISAFFTRSEGGMMFLLWLISWIVALFSAWMLRKFIIKGEQTPFVMELPVYHMPTLRGILIHTWYRTWMYMKKAGTIILAVNVVLWALMFYPRLPEERTEYYDQAAESAATKELASDIRRRQASEELENSVAGRIGRILEVPGRMAGFGWRENIALIGGFAAKEVVVGTLGTAYSMGEVDPEESKSLSKHISEDPGWNPLRAFAMMLFVMVYAPCFVTIAVIYRETRSLKWALFSTGYQTVLGYILAVAVYQIGLLFAG